MSVAPAHPPGALDGVRVLDLTSVIMGPYATQLLGDLGAEVITIEPGNGETNRIMSPGPHRQLSGIALNILRNKRNVALDLKTEAGRDAALAIAATCDVFVTNLRPGPLGRIAMTYDDIRAVRPDVVYCQAQGYPTDDRRADEPAYDDVIQAATGVADAAARASGTPALAPTIMADKVCGLAIVNAVLAALVHRGRTGSGQRVEVAMVETMQAFMLVEHGAAAIPEPPLGDAGYVRILQRNRRPHESRDGWIHVLPYSAENWQTLLDACGRSDLRDDPRVVEPRLRLASTEFLYDQVLDGLRTRTTVEWMEFCRLHAIPASAVTSLDELVAALPLVTHPIAGEYRQIPHPARLAGTPATVRRPAPLIGEHTREVLLEAGLTDTEVATLIANGIARVPREQPA
jgi:crotonobetainyl-CoA:carnitine CoA-transferase CaiB-like acyl-CoA transferase